MTTDMNSLSESLDRILALYGADEGFYVLALFSWIEAYSNELKPEIKYCETFQEKLDQVFLYIKESGSLPKKNLQNYLKKGYRSANQVRHNFEKLSKEEAISHTKEFLDFCNCIHWYDRKLDTFSKIFQVWNNKSTPVERQKELIHLRILLKTEQDKNKDLQSDLSSLQASSEEIEQLRRELCKKSKDLTQWETSSNSRKEKNDELRKELYQRKDERKQLEEQLRLLQLKEHYLSYLERFTRYTRSRSDYERSVMQLSYEQKSACDRIQETGDYLLQGPAGTGKSLVLIHALNDYLKLDTASLDLGQMRKSVLLTYTNTLVRFNNYLSSIVSKHQSKIDISTVDHFFFERIQKINPQYEMDYRIIEKLIEENLLPFLSAKELEAEIENVIFGRKLDAVTYLESPQARLGMKKPLSKKQKMEVWELAQTIKTHMLKEGKFSKTFSRLVLLEAVQTDPELLVKCKVRRLFIDEIQDLSPVDVHLLKLLSESGLVMVGDENQAIYQAGFSFKKLGVDIVGHSLFLSTNYRNTRQIFKFAQLYQTLTGAVNLLEKDSTPPYAFREGPFPELWKEKTETSLMESLVERIYFFQNTLQYDAESLAVLVPKNKYIEPIKKQLAKRGIDTCDIRKNEFDFETTPGVRVSTIHSAKGVEFPVVMLYVPDLPVSSRISQEAAVKSCRNLVYVGITRCVDNLQVFMLENSEQDVVNEIQEVFELYQEQERIEDQESMKIYVKPD